MKNRIREITARSNALGYKNLKKKLKGYVTGWINYFKLADMKNLLMSIYQWLRRRIRMYIWKRWKRVKTRYEMLRKLGFDHNNARKYSCTRKGYWHIANSQILNCTITDKRLRGAGYTFFLDYYKTVRA
jgi:Group II intron, maturase-specific domain.